MYWKDDTEHLDIDGSIPWGWEVDGSGFKFNSWTKCWKVPWGGARTHPEHRWGTLKQGTKPPTCSNRGSLQQPPHYTTREKAAKKMKRSTEKSHLSSNWNEWWWNHPANSRTVDKCLLMKDYKLVSKSSTITDTFIRTWLCNHQQRS